MEDDGVARFSIPDYVVFALVLAISAAIGLFYALTGGKQRTTNEFLMANRNMNWFPVSASLLASFMSAITILGTPGEVYSFGTVYVWLIFSYPFTVWISAYVYLPVFFHLKVTSVYEYIGMRFNKAVRVLSVIVYIIKMLLYMGMVLYAPATAFMQVTGLNLWISILSVGIVCTFYTTLGGMKAVLWTDTFQIFIMYAGIVAAIIQGCILQGGGAAVWETARVSGRLDFYDPVKLFDADPRTRHTIWTQVFGGIFVWGFVYSVNQAQVQRALTLPSVRSIKLAYGLNAPGLALFGALCSFCGLIIYSHYKLCDPLTTGQVTGKDQLYPLYVVQTMGAYQGVPGLVLASVFSGALSTVSSGLNSLSAVTLKDLVQVIKPDITERQSTLASKILALIYGILSVGIASITQYLGSGILSAALALFGILGGPLLGLFSLGLFFSMSNSWGALIGFSVGVVFNLWMGLSQLISKPWIYKYPTSVMGCNITGNASLLAEIPASEYTYDPASYDLASNHRTGVEALYDVSYQWMACIGCFTVIFLGLLVSVFTGCNKGKPVDKRLLTPFFHQLCCFVPNRARNYLKFGVEPPSESDDEDDDDYDKTAESYALEMDNKGGMTPSSSSSDVIEEKKAAATNGFH